MTRPVPPVVAAALPAPLVAVLDVGPTRMLEWRDPDHLLVRYLRSGRCGITADGRAWDLVVRAEPIDAGGPPGRVKRVTSWRQVPIGWIEAAPLPVFPP